MMNDRKFGGSLRRTLVNRRVTVRDLSKRSGISTSDIYRIINGEYYGNMDTWVKIADALGVSLDLLTGRKYGKEKYWKEGNIDNRRDDDK